MKYLVFLLSVLLSACASADNNGCEQRYTDLSNLLNKTHRHLQEVMDVDLLRSQVYQLEDSLDALEVDLKRCLKKMIKLRIRKGYGDEYQKYYRATTVINRTDNFINTYFHKKKLEEPYTIEFFILSLGVMVEEINKVKH